MRGAAKKDRFGNTSLYLPNESESQLGFVSVIVQCPYQECTNSIVIDVCATALYGLGINRISVLETNLYYCALLTL